MVRMFLLAVPLAALVAACAREPDPVVYIDRPEAGTAAAPKANP